jgi:hypothetical protein
MDKHDNETIISKKRSLFFTTELSMKKALLWSPLVPFALGVAAGAVIGGKLFKTSNIEGKLFLTSKRLVFEATSLGRLFGAGQLEFEIILKNITKLSTGKRALKKTLIVHTEGVEFEFSIFSVNSFKDQITKQIKPAC